MTSLKQKIVSAVGAAALTVTLSSALSNAGYAADTASEDQETACHVFYGAGKGLMNNKDVDFFNRTLGPILLRDGYGALVYISEDANKGAQGVGPEITQRLREIAEKINKSSDKRIALVMAVYPLPRYVGKNPETGEAIDGFLTPADPVVNPETGLEESRYNLVDADFKKDAHTGESMNGSIRIYDGRFPKDKNNDGIIEPEEFTIRITAHIKGDDGSLRLIRTPEEAEDLAYNIFYYSEGMRELANNACASG